jgi:hypothetical protein
LTSIKLKMCALPWGPPLAAHSRSSFLRLRRSSSPTLRTVARPSLLGLPTCDFRTRLTLGHATVLGANRRKSQY